MMDPLITNGIDPALLRVLEKRGQERDPAARRKRPAMPRKAAEEEEVEAEEEDNQDPLLDPPKHALDDLA
jgi:hypothetical protein